MVDWLAPLGTEAHPIILRVPSMERAEEVSALCEQGGWKFIVGIEPDKPENTDDLEAALLGATNLLHHDRPGRNEPCHCGSGRKYKKCCERLHENVWTTFDTSEQYGNDGRSSRNDELLRLLSSEGDRLSRSIVDECVQHGASLIPSLSSIVRDEWSWRKDGVEWWAAIHATCILGAIGGERVVAPLVAALRMASVWECDWVTEMLPSMFGAIGPPALPALRALAEDPSNHWFQRVLACEGMAAIALRSPHVAREVFACIASLMRDRNEDQYVRGLGGSVLLDCRRKEYCTDLLEVAWEQDHAEENGRWSEPFFSVKEVREALAEEEPERWQYEKDWLAFYAPEAIAERQVRWKKEARDRSWWFRPVRPFARWMERRKWDRSFQRYLEQEAEKEKTQQAA